MYSHLLTSEMQESVNRIQIPEEFTQAKVLVFAAGKS
jgi:hypothetical protein